MCFFFMLLIGLALRYTGKFPSAILAYQRAIEINKNSTMAYFNLGNLYQDLMKHDLAIANFIKVIQIDCSHSDAQFNLAVTYQDRSILAKTLLQKKEDLISAYDCYQEVYKTRPDIIEAKTAIDNLSTILNSYDIAY